MLSQPAPTPAVQEEAGPRLCLGVLEAASLELSINGQKEQHRVTKAIQARSSSSLEQQHACYDSLRLEHRMVSFKPYEVPADHDDQYDVLYY